MRRSHRVLAALLAIGPASSSALAATTTWTNPAGGLWTDAGNWSNGVPGTSDLAVLPGIDGDGYDITITGSISAGVLQVGGNGANVRLVGTGSLTAFGGCYVGLTGGAVLSLRGPTMHVIGSTAAGGSGGSASLEVRQGSTLTTGGLTLSGGSGGAGSLLVQDPGSLLFATAGASVGTSGVGLLQVDEGATFAAAGLTLGSQAATVMTLTNGQTAPIQLFGPLQRGGALTVILGDGFQPVAHAQLPLITSQAPMTSQWGATNLPTVFGEATALVPTALGEMLELPDPFVDLVVVPDPVVVPVGFAVTFDVYRRRLSGATDLLCCDGVGDLPVSVSEYPSGPGDFGLASTMPLTIVGILSGATTMTVKYPKLQGFASVMVEPSEPSNVERISVTALGTQSSVDTPPLSPALAFNTLRTTPGGRYVLFTACAPEFLPQPANGPCQLYLKDRVLGTLEVVSRGPDGAPASGGTPLGADMSEDGRFVVFSMAAPNFLPGDPSIAQIWLRDRLVGTTELVTGELGPSTPPHGNQGSYAPRITPDAHYVVFATDATNLAGFDNNGTKRDILRWDRLTDQTEWVSKGGDGLALNLPSNNPACSADGRYVAFASAAPNVAPEGLPILSRIYVKDMVSGELTLESVASDGAVANGTSDRPALSHTGRTLAFDSLATNLGPGASSAGRVWVRDRAAKTTTIVDVSQGPEGVPGTSSAPALSGDGRFVALVAKPLNNPDFPLVDTAVFRVDLLGGDVQRVARGGTGAPLADCFGGTAISDDGKTVLFASAASDLVPFDTNGALDVFAFAIAALPGDLDGDGSVGAADLATLLGQWGQSGGPADLDGDGVVGSGDLAMLLGAWTA